MKKNKLLDNRIYIGIDPGKSGGLAFIYNDKCIAMKCPSTVSGMAEELEVCNKIAPDIQKFAIIEAVHSMPSQGVRSVFTFGQNYGQWLGVLAASKISYVQVTPQKWMRHYGSLPKEKKERKHKLKHLAEQRYPDIKVTLATSDAILLANYLRETKKK